MLGAPILQLEINEGTHGGAFRVRLGKEEKTMFPEIDLLTNLITRLKWLQSALEALTAGYPLPPIQDIPEGPIGQLIQAVQQVEQKFNQQQELFQQNSRTLRENEVELQDLRAKLESANQELRASFESREATQHELQGRILSLEDLLIQLNREKAGIEECVRQLGDQGISQSKTSSQEAQAFSA